MEFFDKCDRVSNHNPLMLLQAIFTNMILLSFEGYGNAALEAKVLKALPTSVALSSCHSHPTSQTLLKLLGWATILYKITFQLSEFFFTKDFENAQTYLTDK